MTLEDLLYKIGETAIKNKIINFSAVGGDIYDLNVENVKDYPVLFAAPTGSHEVRQNTTDYEVTFYFLDRLLSDSVNDVQIFSTAIEQLKLILNMVENIKGVLDVSDDYDIQNFTETERMNDRVAGAFATVNITVQNTSDCCDTEFITLMLKLENKTLNVTKNGKYTVTYNKQYDGLRKVEVDVNVDTETPYNDGFADGKEAGLEEGYVSGKADGIVEGIDQGKELAAADAIVVNVEKNGTIYTKFSEDIPEFNEPLTGDDFYSYARIYNKAFNTNCKLNTESTIEFWYYLLGNDSGGFDELIVEEKNGFKLLHNYREFIGRGLQLYLITKDGVEVDIVNDLKEKEWTHIVLNKNKIVVNGVEQIFDNELIFNGGDFYIGGETESVIGNYGMFKIDDEVFVPSFYTYINRGTGEKLLDIRNYDYSTYTFYNVIPPVVYDNLIKEINVNAKINVHDEKIKLAYADRSDVPEWLDWSTIEGTDLEHMFHASKITDFSRLSDVDFYYITSLYGTFENADAKMDTVGLTNWDVSNVTKMEYTFYSTVFKEGDNLKGLKDWDVSNVKDMTYTFYDIRNITDLNALKDWDVSNVDRFSYTFKFYNYSLVDGDTIFNFLENWETSNATNMDRFLEISTNITTIPKIKCPNITNSNGIFQAYSNLTNLVNMGGLEGLKTSWNNNYGLVKCPNLTRESCINILNGLYDFTGNSETPSSSQGKLKVHANFITAVGDDISIATNKGWQVSA